MNAVKPLIVLGDFDSLAYAAGRSETERDMKTTINSKISLVIKRCGTKKILGWVEVRRNKQNFRKHVATTRVYKGTRKSEKPQFLDEAKQYLVDMGWARWCNYVESEDRVLIAAKAYGLDRCIKAYIDKDLDQQEGMFYNYKNDVRGSITKEQAVFNLYHQFLTGDSTDNIVGINGTGFRKSIVIKAKKALACAGMDEYASIVAHAYASCRYSYDYLLEQCRLLYLLRTEGDVFHYPLTREEYDEIYQSYSS